MAFASLMAGVGAALSGDGEASRVNTASVTGANAAANNYLSHSENEVRMRAAQACEKGDSKACATRDRWTELDRERDAKLKAACYSGGASAECSARYADMQEALKSYTGKGAESSQPGLDEYSAAPEKASFKPLLNVPHYDAAAIAKAADLVRFMGNLALDMTPGVGDVKAFAEAQTKLDYVLAGLGVLGPIGDGAKVAIREAKALYDAGSTAQAVEKLGEASRSLKAVGNNAVRGVNGGVNLARVEVDVAKATKGSPEYNILNAPPPSSQVKLSNGTEFKTNSSGYVDEVTYSPSLKQGVRDARQTAVGKEGLSTDVGGHVQACSLGGTCDRFNLFPQDGNFNNSGYKRWENEIKGALKSGDQVGTVTVRLNRTDPASARPDSLIIDYSVNGVPKQRFFENEAGK